MSLYCTYLKRTIKISCLFTPKEGGSKFIDNCAIPLLDETLRKTMEAMSPETVEKLEYIEDLGEATRQWDKIWTEIKAE